MTKPVFATCEQQSHRWDCADQHLCCLLPRQYNTYTCFIQNFKPLARLCSWAGRFESFLVGNPEDRFSHDVAHLYLTILSIAKANDVMLSFLLPLPSCSASFCFSSVFFSVSPFLSIMSRSSRQLIRFSRTSQIFSPPWFFATKWTACTWSEN